MQITQKIRVRRWLLPGLLGLAMCSPVPITYAATIETGFSPEGTALQLVLKTIETSHQEIRLMGYSFTSPEVVRALVQAKRRGVDVKVVLDWKSNAGKNNNTSKAAMNLLAGAGIPVRTVSTYKILHDKVIVLALPLTLSNHKPPAIKHLPRTKYNFTRAADRSNSENVLVVWDDPVVASSYLKHWASRWAQGSDWKQTY